MRRGVLLAAGLLTTGVAQAAPSPPSNFAFLDTGGTLTTISAPGVQVTWATSINSAGVLAGVGTGPDQLCFGFTDSAGTYTLFADTDPGITGTKATGINDSGQISGNLSDGLARGFLYQGGVFTVINPPGATSTETLGIDNAGNILGFSDVGSFLYSTSSDTYTMLLGLPWLPTGISLNGTIVGFDGTQSFLDDHGSVSTLNVPGATSTEALGVNDIGEVVGIYYTPNGYLHDFLYSGGNYQGITLPNFIGGAVAINDAGQVVYDVVKAPEPTSLSLLAIGLAGLVLLRVKLDRRQASI